MNGPEHYREAERLAALAEQQWGDGQVGDPYPRAAVTAQRAQVHATLALAAATVATRVFGPQERWGGHTIEASDAWQEATS